MRYTFSTLNDRDLEELVRDLLSRELGIPFESFKSGPDQGIDLRYSASADDRSVLVQVKHYLKSGLKLLLRDLKKKEYPKIARLAPTHYILVTSLPLNPADKEKIKETLAPFILTMQDIVGQDDLNRMLVNHKEVEEAHFKLWLSSTTVISRILQNAVKGRSAFARERIERQIRLFVPSRTHEQAVQLLNKHNFLLITGAPGIGKSTLSDLLCYQLMAKGFELIYTTDVKEAEDVYLPEKKQVFYLDDFLGTITLDLYSPRNTDAHMVEFIRRVQADKTKRLILTCRTAILNQAKETSERIEQANLELARYEVVLGDYSEYDKARILYNHIYVSSLPERFKAEFVRDQFYWKIIRHGNYNPRTIEFFTDPTMISLNRQFQKSVLSFLINPEKIWNKPYNKQLTWYARLLVRTLYSFEKSDVSPQKLQTAFEVSSQYEVAHHGYTLEPNLFNRAAKELEGAYIGTVHRFTDYGKRTEMRILNPSLEDYLLNYYSGEGSEEYLDVLRTAVYTEQIRGRITTQKETKRIPIEGTSQKVLWKVFTSKIGTYQSLAGNPRWQELLVLTHVFSWQEISPLLLPFLKAFSQPEVSWTDYDAIIDLLEYIHKQGSAKELDDIIGRYFLMLAKSIVTHWQIPSFKKMIADNARYHDRLLEIQRSNPIWYGSLQQAFDNAWKRDFHDYVMQMGGISGITDETELERAVGDVIREAQSTNEEIGLNFSPIFDSYIFDYKENLNINQKANAIKDEVLSPPTDSAADGPDAINRLFNSREPEELGDGWTY